MYAQPLTEKKIERLIEKITGLRKAEKAKTFLKEVFTPREIAIIVRRLEIIEMLDQGHSQRTISQLLLVSTKTITRISKILQDQRQKWYKF